MVSFYVGQELMVADRTMSLLKIMPRAVCRARFRCRFDYHILSWSMEESGRALVRVIRRPVHHYARQHNIGSLECRMNMHMPELCRVRNFSSSRKPLLFTDDLLQKYVKQLVAEWNQIQNQLTNNQCNSGQPAVEHSGKRLPYLEPIVSKVMQHQQYSANITELEDIISGMRTLLSG